MYSVCIAICTGGTMRSETVTSLIGAMDVLKGNNVETNLVVQIGGYVARNRNASVQTAIEKEASHIIFIDNDQTFRPSAIQRLLDHDKDIACAPYNARPGPGRPLTSVVKLLDDKGELETDGSMKEIDMPAGLFKVGGSGTGFMMIKTSIFEKLDKPYFVAWEDENGEHHTEDIDFCIKARKAGFDVWCNPTIPIGHIGTQEF